MKKSQGMTLVEIMLVLVIGGFLVLMSLRQYLSYRLDADVTLIKYNTDALFSAMKSYFQAHCANKSSDNLLNPEGDLSPVVLNIQDDLIATGYLTANQILEVSLVAEKRSGATVDRIAAYQVRFVPIKVPRLRSFKNPYTPETYPVVPTSTQPATQFFVIWQPEVMVLIQDTTKTNTLDMLTLANDCTQTDWTHPVACDGAPALRFAHQASFVAHPGSGSSYWTMLPILGQLRDQEENYGPTVMLPVGGTTEQYYLCEG